MDSKKLLLVDEEETIINTYSFLLNKEGFKIVATKSGSKALDMLNREAFDLVITDLAVKTKNGHTILEEIKEKFPLLPVIVLTEKLSPVIQQFACLLGAQALIEKPCSYEVITSCIKRSLKSSREFQ